MSARTPGIITANASPHQSRTYHRLADRGKICLSIRAVDLVGRPQQSRKLHRRLDCFKEQADARIVVDPRPTNTSVVSRFLRLEIRAELIAHLRAPQAEPRPDLPIPASHPHSRLPLPQPATATLWLAAHHLLSLAPTPIPISTPHSFCVAAGVLPRHTSVIEAATSSVCNPIGSQPPANSAGTSAATPSHVTA